MTSYEIINTYCGSAQGFTDIDALLQQLREELKELGFVAVMIVPVNEAVPMLDAYRNRHVDDGPWPTTSDGVHKDNDPR